MKKMLPVLFLLFFVQFMSAQTVLPAPPDSAIVKRIRYMPSFSFNFQTLDNEYFNALLNASKFPGFNNLSLRFDFGGKVLRQNSGWLTMFGLEFANYLQNGTSNNNRAVLKDYGFNFGWGYNFLYKKENTLLYPFIRIAAIYRDLTITDTKGGNALTFNNYLNGSVVQYALGSLTAAFDAGITYEFNTYKQRQFQNLLGVTAGYRLSGNDGFGDQQLIVTPKTVYFQGFYFGLVLSSYKMKNYPIPKIETF